jgi:hypothetical protein
MTSGSLLLSQSNEIKFEHEMSNVSTSSVPPLDAAVERRPLSLDSDAAVADNKDDDDDDAGMAVNCTGLPPYALEIVSV